ncbi:MAG: EamA family transporter [Acidimicrobiales bacterium]
MATFNDGADGVLSPAPFRRLDLLVTAAAPAAWGLTYVVTTELLPDGRPLLAGVVRALPAGFALAALSPHRPVGSWWWKAAVLGVFNIGAFFALLFVAAYRLPGGVAATLGAVQPLIAAGLAALWLRERFRATTAVAGLLGIVGVGLLVLRSDASLDAVGVIAGLAGALSMATGVVLTKRWGRPVPLVAFTSWQLIAGGLVLMPLALAVEGVPGHLSAANLAGFAWLATGGTAIAYLLWFRGISRIPVGQVSILGLMSPVVATAAGYLVLDQKLAAAQIAGAILVLAAIWIGQRPTSGAGGSSAQRRVASDQAVAKGSRNPDTTVLPPARARTAAVCAIASRQDDSMNVAASAST